MSSNKLNFWQRVALEIIWFSCRVTSILPRWFRYYVISGAIYFFIYRCFKYRVKVVDKNLRNSFPEKSESERKEIRKGFYHYLSEVMVSTISLASRRSRETILSNTQGAPISEFREITKGQSWVALTAHYGLWEYLIFWAQFSNQSLVAVYHPLENKIFDELFKRLRSHTNVVTVPQKETIRFCIKNRDGVNGLNFVIGLIADQNPPRLPNSKWYRFLNQETIFFDGGEKIAQKLKLPVYFIYQTRISRGLYQFEYELIHDGVEEIEPYEITRRYIEKLELLIEKNPHLWLWSHRRWKHDPNKACKQKRR